MRQAVRNLIVADRLPPAWARYAVALGLAGASVGLTAALDPLLGGRYFLLLLAAVVLSAIYGGFRAGLATTFVALLAFVFLFFPPVFTLVVDSAEDVSQAITFTVVAMFFSWVGATVRLAVVATERARQEVEQRSAQQAQVEHELRGSTERLERLLEERQRAEADLAEQARLLDLASDAIAIRDDQSRILYWSRGAEALYGYSREEAVGRVSHDLLQPESRVPVADAAATLERTGRWEGELVHVTRDGARITVSSRWVMQRDRSGQVRVLESNTDITRARHAQQVQMLLVEAGRLLSESLDPIETARRIANLAATHLCDHGVLDLVDGPKLRLRRVALFARAPELEALVQQALPPTEVMDEDNPAMQALRSGEPRLLDLSPEIWEMVARSPEQRAAFERLRPRRVAMLPLRARGHVVGLLSLGWTDRVRVPGREELDVFQAVADRAAVALANARYHEELRTSEAQLQAIIDNSGAVIFVKDTQSRYLLVNRAFEEVIGYSRVDAVGKSDAELLKGPAEHAAALRAHDLEVLRTRRASRMEETVPQADGPHVFLALKFPLLSVDGQPYAVCGIATDITDLKRTQEELRRSSERLQVLHAIDAEIIRAASPEEVARTALGALVRLTDARAANLLILDVETRTVRRWGVSAGEDAVLAGAWHAAGDEQELISNGRQMHLRELAPGGAPHDEALRASGARFKLSVPVVSGARGVGRLDLASVTEQALGGHAREVAREVADQLAIAYEQARLRERLQGEAERLEQQVRERTAALQQANAELEAFSYSVSHDLRAPLRSIDGFTQAIEDDPDNVLTARSQRFFGKVRAASGRMGILIDDLLQLSRMSRAELTRQPVDVTALAAEVVADLRARDPRREVTVSIQPGMRAHADSRLLRVVLENLLGNAWKFSAKQPQPEIALFAEEVAGERVFGVRDNGVGFDMAYADKLFSAFQRMHRDEEFPGTGIGLATVQRIVHRHGGRIWASSQPGEGALFSFTLGGQ